MPWPPSVNTYWRHARSVTYISAQGRAYLKLISQLSLIWNLKPFTERLYVDIKAFPPDHRIRDLDNLLKVTLDSLQKANIFLNDNQIDRLIIERKNVIKGGGMIVEIGEFKSREIQ